jgi:hypothetical protein
MWTQLSGWTQEEIFLKSELSIMQKLPEKEGDLKKIFAISIKAEIGDDLIKLLNKIIIKGFDEKPVHKLAMRSKQLNSYIDDLLHSLKHVVVLIESAHLLSGKTLCGLHQFRENLSRRSNKEKARNTDGVRIVMLGDICRILVKIDDHSGGNDSVSLRTVVFVAANKK